MQVSPPATAASTTVRVLGGVIVLRRDGRTHATLVLRSYPRLSLTAVPASRPARMITQMASS